MKFDHDLCKNLRCDLKKLLCQSNTMISRTQPSGLMCLLHFAFFYCINTKCYVAVTANGDYLDNAKCKMNKTKKMSMTMLVTMAMTM